MFHVERSRSSLGFVVSRCSTWNMVAPLRGWRILDVPRGTWSHPFGLGSFLTFHVEHGAGSSYPDVLPGPHVAKEPTSELIRSLVGLSRGPTPRSLASITASVTFLLSTYRQASASSACVKVCLCARLPRLGGATTAFVVAPGRIPPLSLSRRKQTAPWVESSPYPIRRAG